MKITIFAVLVTLGLSLAGTNARAQVATSTLQQPGVSTSTSQNGDQYNHMRGGGG
jgi:lambda repressor-like predicted transcriptional regulator